MIRPGLPQETRQEAYRLKAAGYMPAEIARLCNVTHNQIRGLFRKRRVKDEEWYRHEAARELVEEGHPVAAVRAVFGEDVL